MEENASKMFGMYLYWWVMFTILIVAIAVAVRYFEIIYVDWSKNSEYRSRLKCVIFSCCQFFRPFAPPAASLSAHNGIGRVWSGRRRVSLAKHYIKIHKNDFLTLVWFILLLQFQSNSVWFKRLFFFLEMPSIFAVSKWDKHVFIFLCKELFCQRPN